MAELAVEIERAKQRAQAQLWDQNEAKLAAHLAPQLHPDLDDEDRRHLAPFVQWTNSAAVRHCPAKPTTVATFVLVLWNSKVPEAEILAQVRAIARLHDHFGLPDPTSTTAAVRYALGHVVKVGEAPRSWRKDEQAIFFSLPPEIQAVIARREQNRETHLRRGQNEIAELKKLLRLQADAETKSAEVINEKENEMAKKKDTKRALAHTAKMMSMMTRKPATFDPGKDISQEGR